MESVDTQTIKTVNNLDFRNDPSVYTTYIVYTPETTDSNKTISVTIPQDTTLNAIHDDEKTSYSGIFYAPQEITDPVLVNKFLSETNMDTVTKIIHIGSDTSDEDTTLVADDSSGQAQNFVVTIDTDDAV